MAEDDSNWILPPGKDTTIPITCHCLGGFYKLILMYNMSKQDSIALVACKFLAGLVKVESLIEENADFDGHDVPAGSPINVPIRCACPGIDANNLRQYVAAKDVPEVRWHPGSLPGSSPAPSDSPGKSWTWTSQPLTPRSSVSSNFSPEFLEGMSKLKQSLVNFSSEELRIATEDFSEASKIGVEVYRGRIGGYYLAIEQIESEEANPYLVYESDENGSSRDCLTIKKLDRQLRWLRRMQIAFDLADALHHLHFCTAPAFIERPIGRLNTLLAVRHSIQVDVFALGVVLLELISGKDFSRDGKILKDSVRFLFDGRFEYSSHCLEKLKEFMDPVLEGDYSSGDAMCLAFPAKGFKELERLMGLGIYQGFPIPELGRYALMFLQNCSFSGP
ncbi:hypothetical protein DKX38_022800 [Salix brachista]|uniref:LYK3/4/5 second LysM domain-containing protein n=1 Tax=Salix brachista TaxID=2182728 RepID=A0A5N5K0F9_9ROSI|nr:hypothetical protein DKX38_022800 [Salix brachista]